MDFIKKYWKVALLGLAGIIIGMLGTMYANKLSEDRIIAALTAEIESLKAKQQIGRINSSEQIRLLALQAQLDLITGRIGICSDCSQSWQKSNCSNCKN